MFTVTMKLILALILAPQAQQRENFSIRGNVIFDNAERGQDLTVFLESLNSRPVVQVRANASGEFSFVNVAPGVYYVRVKQAGFEEFAQRIEVPAFNRPVLITLRRNADVLTAANEITFPDNFEVDIRQLDVPAEAIREYEKALDDDKTGRAARAIQGFRRALGIAPNFIAAAFRFGAASYKAGRLDDAEEVLVRTLKAVPAASHLRLLLANIFVKQRKYQQALLEIDLVLRQNPGDIDRTSLEDTRRKLVQAMEQ
jgi:tetratricopeptide (TPR) repeat protein